MASTFTPGAVETIKRRRPDGSTYTTFRVRWLNPSDGERYTYSGLVDVPDAEDFRTWLRFKGGMVTKNHVALCDGTWRGGDDATPGVHPTKISFGDFARAQIDGRDVSDRTRSGLHAQLRNYFGALDAVRLVDVDEATIRKVLASLHEPHEIVVSKKSGKTRVYTLSPSSIVHYSWFLWGIFATAVKAGTLTAHPFGSIKLDKPEDAHRRLTDEEFNLSIDHYSALMSAAASLDAQTLELLRLILHTGLRIGEALALQVRHIDFGNGRVLVRQQLQKGKRGKDATTTVKGATALSRSDSEREVTVPATALSALRTWLDEQGIGDNPNAFVFARPRCIRHSEPWAYEAWHRGRWSRVLDMAKSDFELPALNSKGNAFAPTPHCLRHTFASRMLNAGMSVYDVSKMLGHKDTKITERIYLHACNDDLHKRAREAAAIAFPMSTSTPTILRNGWYVDSTGTKRRRVA